MTIGPEAGLVAPVITPACIVGRTLSVPLVLLSRKIVSGVLSPLRSFRARAVGAATPAAMAPAEVNLPLPSLIQAWSWPLLALVVPRMSAWVLVPALDRNRPVA